MTLDPKKDFLSSGHKKQWDEIVSSEAFNEAAKTALVVHQQTLSAPPDMATAASFAWRAEGARQFLNILMNISEPPLPVKATPATPNLSWGQEKRSL